VRELVSVATDGAELFVDGRVLRLDGLAPGRDYEVAGVAFRTMDGLGTRRCTFATANDVHFGETVCGLLEGAHDHKVFRSEPGATPYPEVMSAAVVADVAARKPAAVVVKGDLTDDGDDEDYDRFLTVWGTPFGERLVHVRGNHDAYRGRAFAAWPFQSRRLDGVTLAVLDTARPGEVGGRLDADQLEWLDATGADADQPVVVLGHHPVWNPDDLAARGLHGISAEDSDRLVEVLTRRAALVAYLAGHTHRNRCRWVGGVALAEVACVKDFPGAWAEYHVHERGIAQVVRRAMAPAAVAWAERTRAMFAGHYAAYAMGRLEDRAFVVPTPSP
jgi:3',5'-cyclic AMP phosphodiesterase CpdA